MYFNILGDVKAPNRAHKDDAGIDFFVPNDIEQPYSIAPNSTCFIPLKVRGIIPKGHVLILKDKSGVALKKELTVLAGVIDSGYTGEIGLLVANTGSEIRIVNAGDKICQGLLIPVLTSEIKLLEDDDYEKMSAGSERGTGGYGSTGTR